MTGIILAVLASAWVAYFVYCFRDSHSPSSKRSDGTAAFNRSLGALGQSVAGVHSGIGLDGSALAGSVTGARPGAGALLDRPRTPHEASRRRRHVTIGLAAAALASLAVAALLGVGVAAWVVHAAVDVVLIGFVWASAHWKHRSAEHEIRAMLLHHDSRGAGRSAAAGQSSGGSGPMRAGVAQGAGKRAGVAMAQAAAAGRGVVAGRGPAPRRDGMTGYRGMVVSSR